MNNFFISLELGEAQSILNTTHRKSIDAADEFNGSDTRWMNACRLKKQFHHTKEIDDENFHLLSIPLEYNGDWYNNKVEREK